jgi:outer membrane receptor protein involved in Fe transport
MRNFKNVLAIALFMVGATLMAQTKLTGKVVDESNMPLPGADVVIKGTTKGTVTDFDGNFSLECMHSTGTVMFNYMGYDSKSATFNGDTDFGSVALMPSANSLEEVVITGTGIIDLVGDRKTPVAVSTIKADVIARKAANQDLPELLTSTPSVQAVQNGGYGDGSMYLRGFDQTNTAFLLNGQPINGMEDGKMYWSNWPGVLDIANAIQVQRGLGASKLAISSVGGTVNIVTKTVDKKQGGFVQGTIANDSYYKGAIYYNTGLMENGLAVGAMFGHWQGDGYRNGTPGQGQTYYLSFGYKPNEDNIFNFLVTGAPQWHGAAWSVDLQTYLDNGNKFNYLYGYKDGEIYPGGRNYYHKPVANLSWDWSLNEASSLSTVLYGSLGRGGFAYPSGSGLPFWTYTSEDGALPFDDVVASNEAGTTNAYMRGSMNGHNWYGLVSNFETELNDNLTLNLGGDVRFYNGLHFRAVTDFLGLESVSASNTHYGSYDITNSYGGYNPWSAVFNWNDDPKQRTAYDYEENINYYGVFGQVEYAKDQFSTFFQGSISNQSHALTNHANYEDDEKAEKVNNLGYNLKGGLSLNLSDGHKLFVNAGYYSRQPFHDNLYDNIRYSVDLNPLGDVNESVLGFEAGYAVNIERFDMDINLYRTTWGNRVVTTFDSSDPQNVINFQMNGVEQLHKGVELDFSYRPLNNFRVSGFTSIANWEYTQNANARVFDEEGNDITTSYGGESPTLYLKGNKIGGAAQFTAGLGFQWEVVKNLKLDYIQKFYDQLYSEVDISNFFSEDNLGPIRLPSYSLANAGLSYKWNLKDSKSLDFTFNVNNLFDEFYIEYSNGSTHASEGSTVWRGIDTSNNVSIGYGRTWNFSTRFNF